MRAVLIDLDGVIRTWPADNDVRAESAGRLPPAALRATAFEPTLLERVITGAIDDPTWRATIADRLRAQFRSADVDRAVALWSEGAGRLDEDVVALLRRVTMPIVLVTNATSRLTTDLARLGLDVFTHVVNSSEVGVAKPSARIYRIALERVGVPAPEALFVDDSRENVDAARALGLVGHVYAGADALADELRLQGMI